MRDRALWLLTAAFVITGSFFFGLGMAGAVDQASRPELLRSDAFPLLPGEGREESPDERDRRNALLAENMGYVSMEQELVFERGDSLGYAGIENGAESRLGCTVTLIRDGTGEVLYQSKVLDPGYYIENIRLKTRLRKGCYPCTAVWSFYEPEADLLVGNTAGKAVVIINEGS